MPSEPSSSALSTSPRPAMFRYSPCNTTRTSPRLGESLLSTSTPKSYAEDSVTWTFRTASPGRSPGASWALMRAMSGSCSMICRVCSRFLTFSGVPALSSRRFTK